MGARTSPASILTRSLAFAAVPLAPHVPTSSCHPGLARLLRHLSRMARTHDL